MTEIQVLNKQHFSFACDAINALNRFYEIPVELSQDFKEDSYFNDDIRWGIASISYLLRHEYFKIFQKLDKGPKTKKCFRAYCRCITIKKGNLYFFNFLKRVSLIYDMTLYWYREKYGDEKIFLTALKCIAEYEDKEYFSDQGSWSHLTKTGYVLRGLFRPFLLLMLEERTLQRPVKFTELVDMVESRAKKENNTKILDSFEFKFLKEQKEKIIARERDKETKNIDLKVEKEKPLTKSPESTSCVSSMASADEVERKVIIDYFKSYLDREVLHEYENPSLEETKRESFAVPESLVPLELRKSRTDTESTEEYDDLITDSACSVSKKLTVDIDFQSNPSKDEHSKVAEGIQGCRSKHRTYMSSSSSSYFLPTSSNNSSTEERKTRKPFKLEEDLYRSGSSSADGNLHHHPGENEAVSGKCHVPVECVYESIIPSDNEPRDLKIFEDLHLSEGSSDDEYAKQSSMKNETLRSKHTSPTEYGQCSSAESNTLKSQSPRKCIKSSDLKDSHLNMVEEGLCNPSPTLSLPNFDTPEDVKEPQSLFEAVTMVGESLKLIDFDRIGTIVEATDPTGLTPELLAVISRVNLAFESLHHMTEKYKRESQSATSQPLKPVTDTEAELSNKSSESDSDTTGKDSRMSSKPRQHRKGKGRRKKKGRKK